MKNKTSVKKYYLIPFIIIFILFSLFKIFENKNINNSKVNNNIINKIENNKDKGLSKEFKNYGLGLAGIIQYNKEIFLRDKDNSIVEYKGGIEIVCKLNSKECIELLKNGETNLSLIDKDFNLKNDKQIQLLILSWLNKDNNKMYLDIYGKHYDKEGKNNNEKYKFIITKENNTEK